MSPIKYFLFIFYLCYLSNILVITASNDKIAALKKELINENNKEQYAGIEGPYHETSRWLSIAIKKHLPVPKIIRTLEADHLIPKRAMDMYLAKINKMDKDSEEYNKHKSKYDILEEVQSTIMLTFDEHKLTETYGKKGKGFAKKQSSLFQENENVEAFIMVINHYNKIFGNKYNAGLKRSIQRYERAGLFNPEESKLLQDKIQPSINVETIEEVNELEFDSLDTHKDIKNKLYDFLIEKEKIKSPPKVMAAAIQKAFDQIQHGVHNVNNVQSVNDKLINEQPRKMRRIGSN